MLSVLKVSAAAFFDPGERYGALYEWARPAWIKARKKRTKCKHVWSCPSSLPNLCPTARIHRSVGSFFFIPLCDIKHPWRSRYCQTVVQRQVTGNSSFYWFLRTTMQQLYFSLKQMMQTRNTRMNQCDAEDIGCRVWKRLCLLWDLQQRCSSEADEQAAVNTAGLLPFLNWAPDLPRKPSCALLRERKMTKQAPAHVSFPANSCRVLHRVLLNEWHQ